MKSFNSSFKSEWEFMQWEEEFDLWYEEQMYDSLGG